MIFDFVIKEVVKPGASERIRFGGIPKEAFTKVFSGWQWFEPWLVSTIEKSVLYAVGSGPTSGATWSDHSTDSVGL